MIHSALLFLQDELNRYLSLKLSLNTLSLVTLGNVAYAGDSTKDDTIGDKVLISLVNIEEDRISKSHENAVRTPNGVSYRNPKIHLNLYVLISANRNDYLEALKNISFVVQFFQYRNVFDHANNPDLPIKLEKLICDLCTFNFEQSNQLWSMLGGKYIPSVLYKVRLVHIEEEIDEMVGAYITKVGINNLEN